MSIQTLSQFMTEALYGPSGYYRQRCPIGGQEGDFITAPEMTQVFGEVVALWCYEQWQRMGAPESIQVVELGGGRGQLMVDFLRTISFDPLFQKAVSVYIVDVSPLLIERQKKALQNFFHHKISWVEDMRDVPQKLEDPHAPQHASQGARIILANEFFDALPFDQYVHQGEGVWYQRCVHFDKKQNLYSWTARPSIFSFCGEAKIGAIREESPLAHKIVSQIAQGVSRDMPCACLIIDYGYDTEDALGDTFQAIQSHRFCDPLVDPGSADLTHHVNFGEMARWFSEVGWRVHGPKGQREFLVERGFLERTEMLAKQAQVKDPRQAGWLRTAAVRLTNDAHMGKLFRVLEAHSI